MSKPKKQWLYHPAKRAKPTVPPALKAEVEQKGRALIDEVLTPAHVQPPPAEPRFNYITDLWVKWYRSYFYFGSTYASPGPHAISPSFEVRFARMEYVGQRRFNLAYMRHTGKWQEVYPDLTVEDCLATIRDEPLFHP